MRTLVTGGAGFIGSHVVEALLLAGDDVVVIDDFSSGRANNLNRIPDEHATRLTIHEADVASKAAARVVAQTRPEVILLLAAQPSVQASLRDPLLDAHINVQGLVNMVEAARQAGCCKVVFASSGGTIYGSTAPAALPIKESHPHRPVSFYGLTKSLASEYLRLFRQQSGIYYAALALGNVYGPRQYAGGETGVISIFAQQLIDGMPCTINGDGNTTRDYVHVADVAQAFAIATRRGQGVFNIGSGVETSVLDIYRRLVALLDVDEAPTFGPHLPGEVRRVCLDTSRSQTLLGWSPTVDLDQGLATVIEWLRASRASTVHGR